MRRTKFVVAVLVSVICVFATARLMAHDLDSGDNIYRGSDYDTIKGWTKGASDGTCGVKGIAGPYSYFSIMGIEFLLSTGNTDKKAYGVSGTVFSTNAESSGVYGESLGTDGYGVYSKGKAKVEGSLEVTGAIKSPENTNLATSTDLVIASSTYNPTYVANNIKDGIYGRWDEGEWASSGEKAGAWIQLNWMAAKTFNKVIIYPRVNRYDQIYDAWMQVMRLDGTVTDTHLGQFSNGGAPREIHLSAAEGTDVVALKVLITETSPDTMNIGLAEIELYRDHNIW